MRKFFRHQYINKYYSNIYHEILNDVYKYPHYKDKEGYRETLNVSFCLTNPEYSKVVNSYKEPNYKYGDQFFNHIMSGETNIDKLAQINPTVKKFTDTTGLPLNFTSQYGPRIKKQLPRVLKLLEESPDTRKAVINILSEDDKILWDIETTHEYPCTSIIQFYIRNNKLHTLVQMRSNNIVTTICYDVYLFTSLMWEVWGRLTIPFKDLELGYYYHQISSAHIISKDIETAKKILGAYSNEEN